MTHNALVEEGMRLAIARVLAPALFHDGIDGRDTDGPNTRDRINFYQRQVDSILEAIAPFLHLAPKAEPVAAEFFSYDPDEGVTWHKSADDARECATESLKVYRQEARDSGEWPLDVDSIRWGAVPGRAVEVDVIGDTADFKLTAPAAQGGLLAALTEIERRTRPAGDMADAAVNTLCVRALAAHESRGEKGEAA